MTPIDYMQALKRLYDAKSKARKTLFLASSDGAGKENVMPFTSWAIDYTEPHGWCLTVYVFTKQFTHKLIEQTRQFVVSVPVEDMEDTIDCCGGISGRDHDKLKVCGLSSVKASQVNAPIIKGCLAHFECEVYNTSPFLMTYPGTDRPPRDMTIFEGRILVAHIDQDTGNAYT